MRAIRSCLRSGLVVIGASALLAAPVAPPPTPPAPPQPARVVLAAAAQPLPAPAALASLAPLNLIGQQVTFHIDFLVDFVVTGAQLASRQVLIPGTFVQDIQNGTPLPIAVGRALQTFAEIEIEAGQRLVGFAAEYVSFQIGFVANVLRDIVTFAVGVVDQLVSTVTAAVTPATTAPVQAAVTRTAPADVVTTSNVTHLAKSQPPPAASSAHENTAPPKKPRRTVAATTVQAQGEVRGEDPTGTTEPDGAAATARDRDGGIQSSKADAADTTSPPSGGSNKDTDKPNEQHRQHEPKGDPGSHDTTHGDTGS